MLPSTPRGGPATTAGSLVSGLQGVGRRRSRCEAGVVETAHAVVSVPAATAAPRCGPRALWPPPGGGVSGGSWERGWSLGPS